MAPRTANGCAYGNVNRTLIEGLEKTITSKFEDMDTKLTQLFNHQSTHIPQETVDKIQFQWKVIAALGSVLSIVMSAGITYVLMR